MSARPAPFGDPRELVAGALVKAVRNGDPGYLGWGYTGIQGLITAMATSGPIISRHSGLARAALAGEPITDCETEAFAEDCFGAAACAVSERGNSAPAPVDLRHSSLLAERGAIASRGLCRIGEGNGIA